MKQNFTKGKTMQNNNIANISMFETLHEQAYQSMVFSSVSVFNLVMVDIL
jgi:hypothetical protein